LYIKENILKSLHMDLTGRPPHNRVELTSW